MTLKTKRFICSAIFVTCASAGYKLYSDWSHLKLEPSFETFKSSYPLSDEYLYSEDGRLLSQIRTQFKSRSIVWTELNQIDHDFVDRLVFQEDHHFYEHAGIRLASLGKAFWLYATETNSKRGASTITMQLAKQVFNLKTKSLSGKYKQILGAIKIERSWTKNQILEAYFNLVPFQGEIKGLGTATVSLFQKTPQYLSIDEQQTLLNQIKSPNRKKLDENLSVLGIDPLSQSFAYHYHQYLVKTKAQSFKTHIDYDLQLLISKTIRSHLLQLKHKNVTDAAVLVLKNSTGEVLAYVGNSGTEFSSSPYVDMVQARRQLGSSLKPFLYADAFEKNILNVGSWIEDAPISFTFPNGTYAPKNHNGEYHGWVHPGVALGSSLNIPAVRTLQLVGIESFYSRLKQLGFYLPEESDFYGPSLALGVLDGSLWELTHAYQQFYSQNIFSRNTVAVISWMLSRPQNRYLTFGQDSILTVPQAFAVKTGTSKDMKDNWCVGYNHDYTVGVWVGNADSLSMHNVLGITGAAPIWREIVDYLQQSNTSLKQGLVSSEFDSYYTQVENQSQPPVALAKTKIAIPANNTIYALDPNIPLKNQKILLTAEGDQSNLIWKQQNEIIPSGKWTLKKGWQTIQLYQDGKKIDESRILVK